MIEYYGGFKIRIAYYPDLEEYGLTTVDDDTYDGAPDSKSNIIGYGNTKMEAVDDLLENLHEHELNKPWEQL